MLFSVIIPTFNREASLRKCLDCLKPDVQQFRGNYEVIVSDDAGAQSPLATSLAGYSFVRWVPGPAKGPAANRNNGARHATGDWLVFTDDDCLPSPEWLREFASAVEAHPDITVFEGRTRADRPRRSLAEAAPLNETGGLLWSCNLLILRRRFFKFNGFNEAFTYAAMEDVDLRLRLQQSGVGMRFVQNAVVIHPWRYNGGLPVVWKHEEAAKQFLLQHPEERMRIGFYRSLRSNIGGFVRETLPGLVRYRGRGFLLECVLHLLRVYSAFRLTCWSHRQAKR